MPFPVTQLPDYIGIELPAYIGSQEEFDTSDINLKPIQNFGLGVVLTFEYKPIMRDRYDEMFAFYKQCQRRRRFVLPSEITNEFTPKLRSALALMKAQYWLFNGAWNPSPQIINPEYQMYELKISIKSV